VLRRTQRSRNVFFLCDRADGAARALCAVEHKGAETLVERTDLRTLAVTRVALVGHGELLASAVSAFGDEVFLAIRDPLGKRESGPESDPQRMLVVVVRTALAEYHNTACIARLQAPRDPSRPLPMDFLHTHPSGGVTVALANVLVFLFRPWQWDGEGEWHKSTMRNPLGSLPTGLARSPCETCSILLFRSTLAIFSHSPESHLLDTGLQGTLTVRTHGDRWYTQTLAPASAPSTIFWRDSMCLYVVCNDSSVLRVALE
jgi:hypothetical protein